MRRGWLRASLVIAMLGAGAASGYHIFLTEKRVDQERAAERTFTALGWQLTLLLADVHAAQQAYVAAGQDRGYWMERVAAQITDVRTSLSTLSRLSTAAETAGALEDAIAAVSDLARMDARVRDHSIAGQDLMASDLIFTDGFELTRHAAGHVELARMTERTARDAATTAHRRSQGVALTVAMGAGGLVALLLLPGAPTAAAPTTRADDDSETADPAESRPRPEGRRPDLRLTAALCTDLGRLSNRADLTALLARAAQVLNANGIIIWILDASGAALRPAIGHGYTATRLARLGAIASDSDNATAAACRDGRMHVVPASAEMPGAIAAPIVSSSGCGGVVSLELNDGWEASEEVGSTVTIIAAQLATLVAADPVATETAPDSVEAAPA